MKATLLFHLLIIPFSLVCAQQWQQLPGEPEGGGVTDIYYDESSGDLFVATGSLDWPNGEDGGIRRSTDEGNTWVNVFDAYTSRFVMRGPDENLYASVWDYPSNEGFYRSLDNGTSWDLLTSVPVGNNIFACAIKEASPNIIFIGTGQGIMRSLDNGSNWSYSNMGLPAGTLIRSLAISPDGTTIAAGTVNGLYVSGDDGENWDKVTGDGETEIISSVSFDVEPAKSGASIFYLIFGSETGKLFLTSSVNFYLTAVLVSTLAINSGITRIMAHRISPTLVPVYLASLYAASGGYFMYAVAGLTVWQSWMTGLPPNPVISIFFSYLLTIGTAIHIYLAMYGNSKGANTGSEIYKATFEIPTGTENIPFAQPEFQLFQNFPNPFRDQTRINFELPETAYATLKVFDLAGNEMISLADGVLTRGKHSIDLTGHGLSQGLYYYVLRSNKMNQTRKLVIR